MLLLLRFARHGAGEQENGSAEHQRVENVVEAIVEAGAVDDGDGHVDDEHDEEDGEADPCRDGARFFAEKQRNAGGEVNDGAEVSPNGVTENVVGSEPIERDAGDVVGVEKLFKAVEEHGNCDEESRDCRENVRAAIAPLIGEAGSECERATAESEFAEHQCDGKAIGGLAQPRWQVHEDDEKKKREGEKAGGEAGMNARDHAESAEDEASADEVREEKMPGNPARDERCDDWRECEMFGAEGGERHGVEERAEEDEFVESARGAPIAGEKNHAQADDENRSADGIAPNDGAGNCEGREHGWICEVGEHDDSFAREYGR